MASGEKLYTVNDNVLKDLGGKALIKNTNDDIMFPSPHPIADECFISTTRMRLFLYSPDNSIYLWFPLTLTNRDGTVALRLGFDTQGPYYYCSTDGQRKRFTVRYDITEYGFDEYTVTGDGLSSGEQITLYAQYWTPFYRNSVVRPSTLISYQTSDSTKLMTVNANSLLLRRRGYEQLPGAGSVYQVAYPSPAAPLALCDATNGYDYFPWETYAGSTSGLTRSFNNTYVFNFEKANALTGSSLTDAWISPIVYWASANTGYKAATNAVLTDGTTGDVLISGGALAQDMQITYTDPSTEEEVPYTIPNLFNGGYVAILKSSHSAYSPVSGFTTHTRILKNDVNGIATEDTLNYALAIIAIGYDSSNDPIPVVYHTAS